MDLLVPDAEDEVQVETPGSMDENPTADCPEADAILAAPSPSAASLPFNRALPLLGVESFPLCSQTLRSDSHLPASSEASLSDVGQAPGPAQGCTTWLAWGQSTSRTLSETLTASRGSYFSLSPGNRLKPAAGPRVWTKPHLKQ